METRITFYSDIDSVSFKVKPEQTYDFVILLNSRDSCYTEISTIRTSYFKNCQDCEISQDTIPFTIGTDNRVYLSGSINGSAPLKFLFDNGADNTIILPSAINKGAKLAFDGEISNRATGGTEIRKTSNFNRVSLSALNWKNEQVMLVDKQVGQGDGTIGYDLFEDKIIELDYEKKIMIIYDRAVHPKPGYVKFSMHLNGGEVPSLSGTVINQDKKITADFLFDMGATGCLFLNQGFLSKNNLYGTMETIREAQSTGAGKGVTKTTLAILPEFVFGDYRFDKVPVNLEDPAEHDPGTGVLGMDILKRFNTILDYQNNIIYLKPNALIRTAFKQIK